MQGLEMTDIVAPEQRSRMMSGIKGKDTRPEMLLRSALHRHGFRFRLHYKGLPGKPDMVFPKYRAIILVNGCFWHGHNCHLFKWPKTRPEFWREKIRDNMTRDERNHATYRTRNWKTLVVWECALKGKARLSTTEILATMENWLQFDPQDAELTGSLAPDQI